MENFKTKYFKIRRSIVEDIKSSILELNKLVYVSYDCFKNIIRKI